MHQDIDNLYGIVVEQDKIYDGMKNFLNEGCVIKKKFDYKEYNKDIISKIDSLINKN